LQLGEAEVLEDAGPILSDDVDAGAHTDADPVAPERFARGALLIRKVAVREAFSEQVAEEAGPIRRPMAVVTASQHDPFKSIAYFFA
jgi:hypothetical protein